MAPAVASGRPVGRGRGEPRPKGNGSLRRAINYLGRDRGTFVWAYGALIIATLSQLAIPKLVQNMLDTVTNGYIGSQVVPQIENNIAARLLAQGRIEAETGLSFAQLKDVGANAMPLLLTVLGIILAFAFGRAVFAFVQAFLSEKLSQDIAFEFRNDIFSKIQRLSFSYHDGHQTGQLMIRATDDVEKVRVFLAQGLAQAVQALLLLFGTLIILFLTNWRLTLVVLPIMPIAIILFGIFGALSQPLFAAVQIRLSALNTVLQENLTGIKVVKAFAREEYEQQRFDRTAEDYYSQGLKIGRTFAFLFPLIFTIAQIGQAAILYFSGQQIIDRQISLGQYQEFSLYLTYLFIPLGLLGFIISLVAQAATSAQRIFEILDAKNDIEDKPGAVALPSISGDVEFQNVTFRYFGSSDPVLSDVSLKAKAGQTVALLGATGSGKTTVINLIPRFYDVSAGRVLIDGHDVRDVTLDSLRSQIGIVLQETNLFSGSIRDNIAFGRPDASMDEVVAAATAAAAHDFITGFPDGYDTAVGERGTTLSGGQKQRIAIARALLLNPKLLILDDSTSSVDLTTESVIQKALDNLMAGRTSFVIAQRITTVLKADQILVLDRGRVVASGKHQELMENSDIYAEIYNSQLVGDAEETELTAVQDTLEVSPQGAK